MSDSMVTLVVGLAGILSTLLVSALGLYYTAKGRVAPLRDALFSRQLDMAMQVSHLLSRIRLDVIILSAEDERHHHEARTSLGGYFKDFAELEERSAVILPLELWLELQGQSQIICELIQEYEEQGVIASSSVRRYEAGMAKVALLCRTITGVDQLSEHAISLFSSRKDYKRIVDMEISHFDPGLRSSS
ncbi:MULTISPECIES: hypothetical protein [Pseudomonas]|uniref:hypothetical protein n=1 Tax=Pseudomonas guariconensis TaxID=1288410 RepID=UPI002097B2B2|nr:MULTISPECIES: hypothetical protein [Pseudomonas]MCO7594242.1 hypothetical protein [Pseudomonas guariconensis]MCU7220031.1 hypothetical protein [Pseudomonas brassicacearum]